MPEQTAGRRAQCPNCGRVLTVPTPAPAPEAICIPDKPEPMATSGKAIVSFVLGLLFVFACITGLPAILIGQHALSDIALSGGRLRGRKLAIAGIVLGMIGCLFRLAWLMPATRSAREAARRSQCTNNLKQISLGMLNYHETYGQLPAAAITDKNGKPLLSWRVTILPYLESSPLYSQFHLDEPWDSPHNLSLLTPTPNVYVCPSDKTWKPGMTGYQAVIGPSTAFTPDFTPLSFQDFTDGTDKTVLVGETRRLFPWTKPEDLPFDTPDALAGLGSHHGYHDNGFNVLFADGSVHFLKRSIKPSILRALITRNGNEVVSPFNY
jgi:prepilin-type processing-associated H-X9-DG protein